MKKVPYTLSEDSITIVWEGKPYTIRKDNANFSEVRRALFEARYEDVGDLLDLKKAVEDFVDGEVEVKNEVVYYHGHRLHGVVVDKLIDMMRQGMKDSTPIINYIKNLMENPSSNSIEELYTFLGYRSLPITPEGKVLGYKGVKDDFYSSTGNADTIVVQGTTNESHQTFNGVGETIEVSRRCVDDNKDNHCSFGLHVGSYDYANSWAGEGGRLLMVEFDPQDAVSVPTDCDFQKLRVSKYKVVADITDTRKELEKAVYQANKPIYDSNNDASDDWDDWGEMEDEDEGRDYLYDDDGMDDEWDDNATARLAIRNYVENKLEQGVQPSVKQIRSLQVVRNAGLNTSQVADILDQEGFELEENDEKSLTDKVVVDSQY